MPKYFEDKIIFEYKWDQVVTAFWKKYPNPSSTHVLTEDTIQRIVIDDCLYSQRLITKLRGQVPKWAERFLPKSRIVYVLEDSLVDPNNRVFITYTRNIGMTNIMTVTEKVVYQDSAEYPGCTEAHRVACFESQVYGLSRAICSFGADRFRRNCHKMVQGFNHVLSIMFPNHKVHLKAIQHNPTPIKNNNIREIYLNIFNNIRNRNTKPDSI